MAQPQFRLPGYILPEPGSTNSVDYILKHYVMYRNSDSLTALNHCNGGTLNMSTVHEDVKYVLKAGMVTRFDQLGTRVTKIRVITVNAQWEQDGRTYEDGFFMDSSQKLDLLWGPVDGIYKDLYVLARQHGGQVPPMLDNCYRIAAGFFNTLRRNAIEPAAFTMHNKLVHSLLPINWAELIGEWIISPFTHPSMVGHALTQNLRERFPQAFVAGDRRREAARLARAKTSQIPPPSYFEAAMSRDYDQRDFLRVISLMLSTTVGEEHPMVIALKEYNLPDIDPDLVLHELDQHAEFHRVLRVLTENRKTVPMDPLGLCARIFLLAFEGDDDYLYRNRTLVLLDGVLGPMTWPKELFRHTVVEPLCTEHVSGAWFPKPFGPRNLPLDIFSKGLAERARLLRATYGSRFHYPPDGREVDTFMGLLKVTDEAKTFGSFLGYDVIRDPGPLALTNGVGGRVFSATSWKWTRMIRAIAGMENGPAAAEAFPPTYDDDGGDGVQAVTPLCNGLVHYVSPPIRQEVLDSTVGQAREALLRAGNYFPLTT